MFQKLKSGSGYALYYHPTRKFKTTTIRAFCKGTLEKEVEEQAILPSLLRRGSFKFPSLRIISRQLDRLYGSSLYLDVEKAGENQIFVANLDMAGSDFINNCPDLLSHGIELLNDVLMNPVTENGGFPKVPFEQERLNLERFVKGTIDDKMTYAYLRLMAEMFRGKPFGRFEWGDLERIPSLDRNKAYAFYTRLLHSAPVDIYVVGNLKKQDEGLIMRLLQPKDRDVMSARSCRDENGFSHDGEVIVEEQQIEQSKVQMGFRVDLNSGSDDFYALVLYSAVLGGGAFSKLFKKVRERDSMAYYIYSAYDKLKGVLCVACGINNECFDKVTNLVKECMEDMACGRINDDELNNARESIVTGIRSLADHPSRLIDFNFMSRLEDRESDPETVVEIIRSMPRERLTDIAAKIYQGKTFFLKGTG